MSPDPRFTKTVKCRICGETVPRTDIWTHRSEVHGLHYTRKDRDPSTMATSAVLEEYQSKARELELLVSKLEQEREELQRRLVVLDNIIAKHKKT